MVVSELEKIVEKIDIEGPVPGSEPERQYYLVAKAKALVEAGAAGSGAGVVGADGGATDASVGVKETRRPTACVKTFGCQMNAEDTFYDIPSQGLIG